MNITIERKLSAGQIGTAYMGHVGKTRCIIKIERTHELHSERNFSNYDRQVDFNEFAKKYPNRFMTLLAHGVMIGLKHEQKRDHEVTDKKTRAYLARKDKAQECYYLAYTPILRYTLDTVDVTKVQKAVLTDILPALLLMRKAGYSHNDIHRNNIMYGNGHWWLIDYGCISHEKYPVNPNEFELRNDILDLCWAVVDNVAYDKMTNASMQINPWKRFISIIKKDERYAKIKKWCPCKHSDGCLSIACCVLYHDLYAKALGYDKEITKEQPHAGMILRIIKRFCG